MKRLVIAVLFAAACGSSPPPAPATPPPPADTGSAAATSGVLGLGEIMVKSGDTEVLAVHASGQIEIKDGASWKPIGTLSSDGKMVTADGKTGQLGADGVFTTPEGPVPFKLDGTALVSGTARITIENGKLVGGDDAASSVTITGADTDGTKRTTLLLMGLLETAQHAEASTPAEVKAPPQPKK